MNHRRLIIGAALAVTLALNGCSSSEDKATSSPSPRPSEPPSPPRASSTPPAQSPQPAPAEAERPIPPYHESAEAAKPFPVLMPPERYSDYPHIERVYRIAHRIPGVLAQQPCYCWCNKYGHGSLLDCYASDHGAG